MTIHTEAELEQIYGPLAPYSEHERGNRIRYMYEGEPTAGTIMWVCAPRPEEQTHLVYVVLNDERQYPDFVFPVHVLSS